MNAEMPITYLDNIFMNLVFKYTLYSSTKLA